MSAGVMPLRRLAARVSAGQNFGQLHAMRLATFIVVVAVHLALLFLLPMARRPPAPTADDETTTTLVLIPLTESEHPEEPAQPPALAVRERQRPPVPATQRKPMMAPPAKPAAIPGSATVPAPAPTLSPAPTSAPATIDWAKEAELAATRQLEADEEARRKASALAPRNSNPGAPTTAQAHKPEFGWSHARTHRVESLPQGGFLVNINDRCAIAVIIMLMPVCKFGKIEARGDLFQHMTDPPQLGEWKDQLP